MPASTRSKKKAITPEFIESSDPESESEVQYGEELEERYFICISPIIFSLTSFQAMAIVKLALVMTIIKRTVTKKVLGEIACIQPP